MAGSQMQSNHIGGEIGGNRDFTPPNFSTTITRGKMETTFGGVGEEKEEKQKTASSSVEKKTSGRESATKSPEVGRNIREATTRQRRKSMGESNV